MSLYDLILQGGRVIDPAQDVDGIFDVAIRDGHIATIDADLPTPPPPR
jgi:dihydroorotase